jgi:predicted TIM-barrel fold metal-dependent hydrolase
MTSSSVRDTARRAASSRAQGRRATPELPQAQVKAYSTRWALCLAALTLSAQEPDKLLLKDYHPQSIFKIPQTHIQKAKYPVIDIHYHIIKGPSMEPAPGTPEERLRVMDEVGIEKTIILTLATRERFDAAVAAYGKYPQRFELWCGIDWENVGKAAAITELERCAQKGARGVGEIGDKGKGITMGHGTIHPDDPRMDEIWEKCADLKLPVNLHMADPIWGYEQMDGKNDGLMSAFKWRLDNQKDIVGFDGLMEILERTLQRHPRTTFVACHLANLDFDLARLGAMFDKYPNLYADVSAREHYLATIPRVAAKFIEKYQDRILFGTDAGFNPEMYRLNFRILETIDDHFYAHQIGPDLHWPLYGLGLSDAVLKKVYRENALRILKK